MIRTQRATLVMVGITMLAAGLLMVIGAWLALIDAFIRIQGGTPSSWATLLGATSFGAGIAGTLSARHLRSKSDLAIGVVCGAGAVAAFASVAGGAWVVLVLSITLTIAAGSLRIIPDHVGVPDLASRRDHTGQAAA
jgi:uncharacterized membrane protein YjjP (DUF1212 family)